MSGHDGFMDRAPIKVRILALVFGALTGLGAIIAVQLVSKQAISSISADHGEIISSYQTLADFSQKILSLRVAEQELRAERKAALLNDVTSAVAVVDGAIVGMALPGNLSGSYQDYRISLQDYLEELERIGYRDRQSVVQAEEGQAGIDSPSGLTVDVSNAAAKANARIFEELEFDDQPALYEFGYKFQDVRRHVAMLIGDIESTSADHIAGNLSDLRDQLDNDDLDPDFTETMGALLSDLESSILALADAERYLLESVTALNTAYADMSGSLETGTASLSAAAGQSLDELNAIRQRTNLIIEAAAVITFFVMIVAGLWIARSIQRNLGRITEATTALADGVLDREIPFQNRKTEVGNLARALVVFRDNALDRLRLEENLAQENDRNQQRRADMEEAIQAFRQQITSLMEQAANSIATVSQTTDGLVTANQTNSEKASHADEASRAASENVEVVAGAARQLKGSIEEIVSSLGRTVSQIDEVYDQAQTTNSDVEQLAESASKIDEIILLINSIADQTNLLALNATIEAARSGEHGKGFAVVANEVKSLASQTANATEEIAGQIRSIQQTTQTTVEAMSGIAKIISDIRKSTGTIAAAVNEQSSATTEINGNASSAALKTNQMAGNTSDLQQAAHEAQDAANQLQDASRDIQQVNAQISDQIDRFLRAVSAA